MVIRNLSKRYGDTRALCNVTLQFDDNKIYGLLGRNGAGKTSLLNIIANRIFADSGTVMIDGKAAQENDEVQNKLYMMSEQTLYPEAMKVQDVFKWSKTFYPGFDEKRAKELADKFQLNTKKKVKSLSTGYTSIFKIIIALSVNTPYLLLDEPVLGLDANHRDLFYKELMTMYAENPCTIVISTHLIEEVARVIEEIVIIKDGQIICSESSESLLAKGYMVSGKATDVDAYAEGKEVMGMDSLGGLKTAYIMGLPEKGEIPATLEVSKLDLQKLFIQLTNA
jgi:ABC-2 type transport system ATP-binding protein